QKAVTEIRKTPPKLYLYAIGGAVALIGIIVAGILLYNWLGDRDSGSSRPTAQIQPAAPLPKPQPQAPSAPAPQPDAPQAEAARAEELPQPETPEAAAPTRAAKGKKSHTRSAPAIVPAQLSVSSNPAGARIAFDGSSLCNSPCTLTGIAPGQHTVSA